MLMFDFRCSDCEREFELLVARDEQVCCKHCQSTKVEKLFTGIALAGMPRRSESPPAQDSGGGGGGRDSGADYDPYAPVNAHYGDDI